MIVNTCSFKGIDRARAGRRGPWIALALALWIGVSARLAAHGRSASHSRWRVTDDGLSVELRVAARDLTAVPSLAAAGGSARRDYLTSHLVAETARGACAPVPDSFRTRADARGQVVARWTLRCPHGQGLAGVTIRSELLAELPAHLHFVRVERTDEAGDPAPRERVLSARARAWAAAPDEPVDARGGAAPRIGLGQALALGVEHIAGGLDHLLFLLALLLGIGGRGRGRGLGARERWALIGVVSGFTLGHSVTLGLAALSVLAPDPAVVEALIALSIVLVALENAWAPASGTSTGTGVRAPAIVCGLVLVCAVGVLARNPGLALALLGVVVIAATHARHVVRAAACSSSAVNPVSTRGAIAALFGLVHGFGFAGALADVSLAREQLVVVLLGFNLGVELGQLVVVLTLWPALAWISRRGVDRWPRALANAAVAGAGTYWFVTRAFGG